MKKCFVLSVFLTLSLGLFALVGCGPTRKEYAINEALLMDQTRVLEDQLYRAHYQIQTLERENEDLRAQVERLKKTPSEKELFPMTTSAQPAETKTRPLPTVAKVQENGIKKGQPLEPRQPTRMAHTTSIPPRNLR